ncbi:MAG: beta-propeller domain-containing protein [Oscillospiraceae bacterium]|nr:beta-propeller domain-containing protein [Oscillospiraceae bacterium]
MNGKQNRKDTPDTAFLSDRLRRLDEDIPVPAAARAEYLKARLAAPQPRKAPRWRPALGMASLALVAALGVFWGSRFLSNTADLTMPGAGPVSSSAVAEVYDTAENAEAGTGYYDEAAPAAEAYSLSRQDIRAAQSYKEVRAAFSVSAVPAEEESPEVDSSDVKTAEFSGPAAENTCLESAQTPVLFKTNGEFLYYLRTGFSDGGSPALFIADAKTLSPVCRLETEELPLGFFLSGEQLVLLTQPDNASQVTDEVYSVKDPAAPEKELTFRQEGGYLSSQLSSGVLRLVTRKELAGEAKSLSDTQLIPHVQNSALGEENFPLAPNHIFIPESCPGGAFVVASSLPLGDPSSAFSFAVAGAWDTVSLSSGSLYLFEAPDGGEDSLADMAKFSFSGGGALFAGSASLPGRAESRFFAEERDGLLRITAASQSFVGESAVFLLDSSLSPVGQVTGLAPGEAIRTVCYTPNGAYFALEGQPGVLLAADLSDPASPREAGRLELSGSLELLTPYSETLLLGLESSTADASPSLFVCDVSDPQSLRETSRVSLRGPDERPVFLEGAGALWVFPQEGLAGLSVSFREGAEPGASSLGLLLYLVDGDGLQPLAQLPGGARNRESGETLPIQEHMLFLNGRLYIALGDRICSYGPDLTLTGELELPR